MAKKLTALNPINDDDGDDELPELDKSQPLGPQANARINGKVDLPDSERQVARPLALDLITPDPTQPRREVPAVVRNRAREQGLPEWEMWHQMAERQAGQPIPLKSLLRGEGDGPEDEKTGKPLFDGFMALVALAASIYEKGLVNPITVSARGTGYMIETGERRYQAYRLLYGVLGHKKFSRITANVVPHVDVWRQAAENGSRKPLTAIGMARQLALLIMALTGKEYRPYEDFESDREFYAQVADGAAHRIPNGTAERILQATGLKSKKQLANYRALLDISDALWALADEEDWTENRIREHVLNLKNPERSTTRGPSPDQRDGHLIGANMPISYPLQGPGQKFMLHYGKRVQLDGGTPLAMRVWYLDERGTRTYSKVISVSELRELDDTAAPRSAPQIHVGDIYRQSGRLMRVISISSGGQVRVEEISPTSGKKIGGPFTANPAELLPENKQTDAATALPEWLRVGSLVIHDHDIPEYRVKGNVATVRWDGPHNGYLVTISASGKTYGPYAQARLRPGGGSEPGPETHIDQEDAFNDEPDLSAEDALTQIERGRTAHEDYKNPEPDTRLSGPHIPDGGWQPGMQVITFAGDKGIVLRVIGRQVLIETNDGGQISIFEGNMRLLTARELTQTPAEGDESPDGQRISIPPVAGQYVKYWEYGKQRVYGTIQRSEWDNDHQDYRVFIRTETGDKAYFSKTLTLAGDDTQPAAATGEMPDGGWQAGMRVVTPRGARGVVMEAKPGHRKVWVLIDGINLDSPQPFWAETLRVEQAQSSSQPREEEIPPLPEWAASGKRVIHIESGKPCVVDKPTWEDRHSVWVLRVHVDGHFDYGRVDAFRPDDGQFQAAPRERHPSLDPANANGTICQEQLHIGQIEDGARRLKLLTNENSPFLTSLRALTAEGLRTRIRNGGAEQTGAYLDAAFMTLREIEMAKHEQLMAAINQMEIEVAHAYQDILAEASHGAAD